MATLRSVSHWTGDHDEDDVDDDDDDDDRCPKLVDRPYAPVQTAVQYCGFEEEEQKLMICCPEDLVEEPSVVLYDYNDNDDDDDNNVSDDDNDDDNNTFDNDNDDNDNENNLIRSTMSSPGSQSRARRGRLRTSRSCARSGRRPKAVPWTNTSASAPLTPPWVLYTVLCCTHSSHTTPGHMGSREFFDFMQTTCLASCGWADKERVLQICRICCE